MVNKKPNIRTIPVVCLRMLAIGVFSIMTVLSAVAPAIAMDTLTEDELGTVTGRAGFIMSTAGSITVQYTVRNIQLNPTGDGLGWMVLQGYPLWTSRDSLTVTHTVKPGDRLALSEGTTGATEFVTNGVHIPAETTFFAVESFPGLTGKTDMPGYVGVYATAASYANTNVVPDNNHLFGAFFFGDKADLEIMDLHTGFVWAH